MLFDDVNADDDNDRIKEKRIESAQCASKHSIKMQVGERAKLRENTSNHAAEKQHQRN
jgi:hypothetical protein